MDVGFPDVTAQAKWPMAKWSKGPKSQARGDDLAFAVLSARKAGPWAHPSTV